jgi:hypothetical protein
MKPSIGTTALSFLLHPLAEI